MESIERREQKIRQYILDFETSFFLKFGMSPTVTYEGYISIPKLRLQDLEDIGNRVLDIMKVNNDYLPDGIKTKTRKRRVSLIRHCIYRVARDIGFRFEPIATQFGFGHSNVIQAVQRIDNLIDIKDKDVARIMKLIKDDIQKNFGIEGDIQSDNTEEPDSKPVLPAE